MTFCVKEKKVSDLLCQNEIGRYLICVKWGGGGLAASPWQGNTGTNNLASHTHT